jgi:hydrogenase-4 component E
VITSVAAVEIRRLRLAAVAYSAQALLIVGLLLSFAAVNPSLYWWAGTAFLTKAVLTPWFLFRFIGKTQERELPPLIGFAPSVMVAAALMIGFYRLTHSQIALLAPTEMAQQEVFRTNLAVASTVFALGLYCVLTRRDAIKSLAPELSETALFGVATEVVVTVYLLLYVIAGVRQEFGTTDTLALKELQW